MKLAIVVAVLATLLAVKPLFACDDDHYQRTVCDTDDNGVTTCITSD